MTPRQILIRRGALAALAAISVAGGQLVGAQAAAAHGIGADASDKSALEFLPLGIEHMLLGWDHLLFIAGVLLLAWRIGRAVKLISAFVVGHSSTLIVATLAGWQVNAGAIDAVIGLSVFVVGFIGLYGRPNDWRWFYGVVFGFGLLHGLGLSTRLQDLGLPEDGLLPRVIFFNLGVEIGQLLAIAVMAGVGALALNALRRPRVQQGIFASLGVTGAVAAAVFAGLAAIDIAEGDEAEAVGSATNSCTVGERTFSFGLGGAHPAKDFFEPGEPIPGKDFGHVLGDGYLAVTYRPGLPAADLDQVRAYTDERARVLAGERPEQTAALHAVNAYEQLTCENFDLEAVRRFVDAWFADPRSRPVQQ